MSKRTSGLRPGQIAPQSGQYQITGPRGGQGPERTVVRGEPLPPHSEPAVHLLLGRPDQDEVATKVATGATAFTFNSVATPSF